MHFVLDMPWGQSHKGVTYWKDRKIYVYKGPLLPAELRPYRTEDFSYGRWQEDELNGMVLTPEKSGTVFTPREHQKIAAKGIYKAYALGWSGFLEADKTGLGKTLSTLAGVTAIAKSSGYGVKNKGKLLIVCPKSVIPQWRQTLHNYPISTALLRVVIINYQQLNKLLETPSNARVVKKAKTKNRQTAKSGKPLVDWNYIIFDEAQYLKNYPSSSVSMAAASVAKLNSPYKKDQSPFVVFSTATPGSSPLNFSLMCGFMAPLISKAASAKSVTPDTWGAFLASENFAISKGKSGYSWATIPWYGKGATDPKEKAKHDKDVAAAKLIQRKDARRIGQALISEGAPFIMRAPKDIAGWPEQQFIPFGVEMTSKQRPIYEEAWTRFRDFLRLPPARQDSKSKLVENLRYRQKSSLLKVDSMIETVVDFVEAGNQVYISCQFIDTIESYKEKLEAKKIRVVELSGRNAAERTEMRLKFQRGEADVVLCTVTAGISLHAGEILPDGTKASSNPRISIIHDIRGNNLDAEQTLGRAHRDGTNSLTYFPYLEKTVDEQVIASYTNKTANMNAMTGRSTEESEQFERLFREAAVKTTPPNRMS